MRVFLKEIKFPSTEHTYVRDITSDIGKALKKSKAQDGVVFVNTKHTTLGVVVQEIAEPNLIRDILHHSLLHVPEDKRSTHAQGKYPHPTTDYTHRCQDNPFCDEIDQDYNAAAHIRALLYSHPSVTIPFKGGKLELGKYQQIALFEFDGRDGKGKNPMRQRVVQIWIYPTEGIKKL